MHYAEFEQINPDKRGDFLRRISPQDRRDLIDQKPYSMVPPRNDPRRTYFDDPEEFYQHILRYWVPETKPWRADAAIEHELSHGRYALAIGAIGVRYSMVLYDNTQPLYTEPTYPAHITLPNLAATAVSANPFDSWIKSNIDRGAMLQYGYASREYVAERIARWNDQKFGAQLPELDSSDEAQQYIYARENLRLDSGYN